MELHKAIKVVINSKGVDMICNPQIINYLLDYQAFKEKPATKLILRAIIDSGYAENILALTSDKNGWEMKFKQYQHEFIDSCGYKEELAAYVFDSIAYGLDLGAANVEPEIKPKFNVDSFFDIPEVEQKQQPSSTQSYQKPSADPSDLYTIAMSFFNEGKCQQAKGFMEKALSQYPQSNIPALYLKLMGDIHMKIGSYQEAIQYYNECFSRKAAEGSYNSLNAVREDLKRHKIKGFENSMFCYFFCLYYAKGMSDAQWVQFVKSEAKYGLMDAIQYCANNGINPIDDHFDIYFADMNQLKSGDILYIDGTFSHELSNTKTHIARIAMVPTSDFEKAQGWTHGYIIPLSPISDKYVFNHNTFTNKYIELAWSNQRENLAFPHSHYTIDDLNHWDEISKVESEQFISFNDYHIFPAFRAIELLNKNCPVQLSRTSRWFLPSIHSIRRIRSEMAHSFFFNVSRIWTSSQCDANNAISFDPHEVSMINPYHSNNGFYVESKFKKLPILPIAAF